MHFFVISVLTSVCCMLYSYCKLTTDNIPPKKMNIKSELKAALAYQGMRTHEFFASLGVSHEYGRQIILKMEAGHDLPDTDTAARVAGAIVKQIANLKQEVAG